MFRELCKDLTIIELASVLAGPSVGAFFAEQGANVIKIENAKTHGDVTRSWKTVHEKMSSPYSSYFSCVNFGKKSIGIDLTNDEGKNVLYELIKNSDIVISSYKKDDDVKLGVSYEQVRKFKPTIIYGKISGYGEDSSRTGYDAIIQAESGIMSINGDNDSAPCKLPIALVDVLAGHHLKEAILLALWNREKNGEGKFIPISLYDSALTGLINQATNFLNTGINPQPIGSDHPNIVPYGSIFTCKDKKQILLAVGTDKQFHNLLGVLDIPQQFEKFSTNAKRVQQKEALLSLLKGKIQKHSSVTLIEKLHKQKIPVGRVNSIENSLSNDISSQMIIESDKFRSIKQSPFSNNFDIQPPPILGSDTTKILEENHFPKEKIDQLKANGVIY